MLALRGMLAILVNLWNCRILESFSLAFISVGSERRFRVSREVIAEEGGHDRRNIECYTALVDAGEIE